MDAYHERVREHVSERPRLAEQIERRYRAAQEIAQRAGELTLRAFGERVINEAREHGWDGAGDGIKADGSPVTETDLAVERFMRERIAEAFPGDGVLGEEEPDRPGTTGFTWLLDPIDGTKSFMRGVPLYATLVAVAVDAGLERSDPGPGETATSETVSGEPVSGEPADLDAARRVGSSVAGVIHLPALRETVHAAAGLGCWHEAGDDGPVRSRVSSVGEFGEACVCATTLNTLEPAPGESAGRDPVPALHAIAGRGAMLRGWSDAYAHLLVATGRADAVVEPIISPWDVAPMPVIMGEAGGRYSAWSGRGGFGGADGVSSNGRLHGELLDVLAAHA